MEAGGRLISARRKEAGMSQPDLSEASGVPMRTIQDWESRGVAGARLGGLARVAGVLGLSLDELAGR